MRRTVIAIEQWRNCRMIVTSQEVRLGTYTVRTFESSFQKWVKNAVLVEERG